MPSRRVIIPNPLGLHASASSKLVQLANRYPCRFQISHGERSVNGKSILGVMLLAVRQGSEVRLDTEGEAAEAALDALCHLIAQGFGEMDTAVD